MQRVWNHMFTFIGPVHLAILTHHHHNIHNNIDNNNNNTVSATHTQKEYFVSPLQQKWHCMHQFCILLSKQYTQFKRRLYPITIYGWKKVCGVAFHHWCWQSWAPPVSHFSWLKPITNTTRRNLGLTPHPHFFEG